MLKININKLKINKLKNANKQETVNVKIVQIKELNICHKS